MQRLMLAFQFKGGLYLAAEMTLNGCHGYVEVTCSFGAVLYAALALYVSITVSSTAKTVVYALNYTLELVINSSKSIMK